VIDDAVQAFDVEQLRALQQMPVASIGRVSRVLRRRLDTRLERFDITGVQFGLLALVAQADGLSQTSLQRQMQIEGATLTQLLQRLEREGWIIRTSDRLDRRRQRVWMTDRGREMLSTIANEVEQHRKEVRNGISDDELALFGSVLRRLEENGL
jgi:DNA-binding MarR family transcriptional regulator